MINGYRIMLDVESRIEANRLADRIKEVVDDFKASGAVGRIGHLLLVDVDEPLLED